MAALIMEITGIARRCCPAAAVASMILFAGSLHGSTITLASSAATVENNSGMATINIHPNPVWAPPLGTSSWISFSDTGFPPDPTFSQIPNGTVITFTDTFTLDGPVTAAVLDVLADDTTTVFLNGHMIMPATVLLGTHCTSQPIGCLANTEGHLATSDFGSFWQVGQNVLRFDTQQLGSQSFGLDFAGTITTSPSGPATTIPEPSAVTLGSVGLLALLFIASRRRVHKSI